MGVTREPRVHGNSGAAVSASAARCSVSSSSAASAAAPPASGASSSSSSRKVKDRGARFNEKHALKYGLSICSRHAKDQSVEMVMCKFCVAFGKEHASDAPRKRRATANIKYFRAPFRADHYLSHLEINHKTKWDEYEHATMPEKELFFAANAEPAALAPQSIIAASAAMDAAASRSTPLEAEASSGATNRPSAAELQAAAAAAAAANGGLSVVPRVVPVRLPASEIEKDVVEVLVGDLFFNAHEEEGVTKEHALELFVRKDGSPNYEICIKNQRLYDLAVKFVANGSSYRLASRLVYCVREETKLSHYGGCTDARVANYVRAVLASNLQRLAWMMRAAWTYAVATETVHHQATAYLDVRVRLWHNSGLRDFHLLAIPQFDRVPAPAAMQRLVRLLDILDPRWRHKLLGTTAHGGLHTGRERGFTAHQQGLAARLTGLVRKPHFYLVWSGAHQLEVVAKNAVTALADGTFYEQLAVVVQTVRRAPSDEARLPHKNEELASMPAAHASPRGFVATLLTTLRWLQRHRVAVSALLDALAAAPRASFHVASLRITPAWWVCAAVAQRLVAELEFFIKKLAAMDQHEASVQDHVQELGKLALVLKDVVGATRDFVDFFPDPVAPSSSGDRGGEGEDVEISAAPSSASSSSSLFPLSSSPSVARGSFVLSLHNAEQFVQHEGGAVAIEMLDLVTGLERGQLARSVALFAVDVLASVAAVAHEGRHYCGAEPSSSSSSSSSPPQIVVAPPRVLPYEIYQMGKDDFLALVAVQTERLRETFSAQEIRRIQNEYFFFLAAVETEPILSGVLKKHGRDTDVSFAWSCLNSRFYYLQEFVGGLASVVPDAMSGTLHAELLFLNWEKPDYRLTGVDFALEGILHARQKMQIEVVDVNHLRAAMRAQSMQAAGADQGASDGETDPRRPAIAIDTATAAGGSLAITLHSAHEADDDDDPMEGHGASVPAAASALSAPGATEKDAEAARKPARLGEGYTIV